MLYPCYGGMLNGGIAMHHTEEYKNHDELRGRFTVWLEKVVRNAKINYIKSSKDNFNSISGRNIGISIAGTEFSRRCIYEIRI